MATRWYDIQAKDEHAEIVMYGDIGAYDITAKDFRAELFALKANEISLRINSRGGDVFEGVAIFNALKEHPAKITAHIDSLAASISSFIPMAADRRVMAKNARIMVHFAWSLGVGNATDFRKLADLLDDVDTILVDEYTAATGMNKRDMREMMAAETWLTPKKAKEYGFIDEIAGEEGTKAEFDLSPFKNVPSDVLSLYGKTGGTERDIEQLLRDAGVSRMAAKSAIAAIKGAPQRDAEEESSFKEWCNQQSQLIQARRILTV